MTGRFITFEGGEGGGKSTQVAVLADRLRTRGLSVVTTREPGGVASAEEIRSLLVSGAVERWTPMAEVLLNYAAREMHVTETIKPALKRGDWVISDRFSDSTMVYQGYAGGVEHRRIQMIHDAVLNDFIPDMTIIMDLDVNAGLSRAGKRIEGNGSSEDRFERKPLEYHARIRDGFLQVAQENPMRCSVIDAATDVDTVSEAVFRTVLNRFGAEFL